MTAKILLFDIETAPSIVYAWGRWKVNVAPSQVIQEGFIMTWAAKWLGSDEYYCDALPYHKKEYKADPTNDKPVVESLKALIDEADIIMGHNGDKFDIKWLNTQLAKHNLDPISAQKSIDTLKIAKQYFRFPSNRLDALADYLGIEERKLSTDFSLWSRCLDGDQDAWDDMVEYNVQDLYPLEELYKRLRPFMKNHPNLNVYDHGDETVCPNCGGKHLKNYKGYYYTNLSKFRRYECLDCGRKNIRGRVNLLDRDKRDAIVAGGL